tara:strand:+ start:462 stop:710 length:249 start_codon:yes stop_codon:yes gene_type:complete
LDDFSLSVVIPIRNDGKFLKTLLTAINDQIFFVENTHKIEEYYQSVDLFVLSSKQEGLPNALLETMACGLPVITSRIEEVTD